MVVVADPVERRRGQRMKAPGCYREAVRSTQPQGVQCLGLTGVCRLLRVRLPWSARRWALPFLPGLAPSEAANHVAKKRHKTPVDWTEQLVQTVSRW